MVKIGLFMRSLRKVSMLEGCITSCRGAPQLHMIFERAFRKPNDVADQRYRLRCQWWLPSIVRECSMDHQIDQSKCSSQ